MDRINELDVVALIADWPHGKLCRGQVGTVVRVYDESAVEVEFVSNNGRTYAMETIPVEQLLLLHYEPIVTT